MSYRGLATQSAGSVAGAAEERKVTKYSHLGSANSSGDFGLAWSPVEGFCEGVGKADTVEVWGSRGGHVAFCCRDYQWPYSRAIQWRFWGPCDLVS